MAFPDERCTSSGTRSSHRELIIGFISTQISEVPCQRHPGVLGQIKALAVIASFWSDGPPPPSFNTSVKADFIFICIGSCCIRCVKFAIGGFQSKKQKNKKLLQILTILVLSRVWQSSFLVRHTLTSVHIFSYFFPLSSFSSLYCLLLSLWAQFAQLIPCDICGMNLGSAWTWTSHSFFITRWCILFCHYCYREVFMDDFCGAAEII